MAGSTLESVALIIEVKGGAVPGVELEDLTKRFVLTYVELEEIVATDALIVGRTARADAYARDLRMHPEVRWVSTEWVDLR